MKTQYTGLVWKRIFYVTKYGINTSKYKPHQGTQECARRHAQLGIKPTIGS